MYVSHPRETSSQLISSEIFPVPMIKALLYPGAIVNGLATNMTFPKWDDVLDLYNLTNVKDASAVPHLQRLEVHFFYSLIIWFALCELLKVSCIGQVLAGSYFSVAGAFCGYMHLYKFSDDLVKHPPVVFLFLSTLGTTC